MGLMQVSLPSWGKKMARGGAEQLCQQRIPSRQTRECGLCEVRGGEVAGTCLPLSSLLKTPQLEEGCVPMHAYLSCSFKLGYFPLQSSQLLGSDRGVVMRHEGLGPERKRANCPSVKTLTVTNKWGSAGLGAWALR